MTSLTQNKWLYFLLVSIIFILALGFRWNYINTAEVINPVRGDAAQYYKYAWNLANYGVFSGAEINEASTEIVPDSYRDPGYPALLAIILKITPNHETWYSTVLILQAILGSLAVIFSMFLANYWLPRIWVLIAGLFITVWPHSVVFSGYLLTEILVSFFCTLGLWLLAYSFKRNNKITLTISGLCIGAAGLTNAVLLPFGIILSIFGIFILSKQWRFWLIFLLSASLLPGLWAARNSQLSIATENANNSTYRAYQNLVQGSWPIYHKAYKGMFMGDEFSKEIMTEIHREIDLLAENPESGKKAIAERLLQEPMYYIAWYLFKKPVLLWDWEIGIGQGDIYVYPTINSPLDQNFVLRILTSIMHGFVHIITLLMFACIVIMAFTKGNLLENKTLNSRFALYICVFITLYVTGIYTIFQSEPRYSIPFRPFGILLAVTSAYFIFILAKRKIESIEQ